MKESQYLIDPSWGDVAAIYGILLLLLFVFIAIRDTKRRRPQYKILKSGSKYIIVGVDGNKSSDKTFTSYESAIEEINRVTSEHEHRAKIIRRRGITKDVVIYPRDGTPYSNWWCMAVDGKTLKYREDNSFSTAKEQWGSPSEAESYIRKRLEGYDLNIRVVV